MVQWASVLLLWVAAVAEAQRTPEEDKLRRFYTVADGNRWVKKDNWNTDFPLCSWYGITCAGGSDKDEGVTAINMEGNNLVGKVSKLVYELPDLTVLNLRNNKLTDGGFEAFSRSGIGQNISVINLADNSLTFLTGVGDAPSSLRDLHLTQNRLRGTIPLEVMRLTNLRKLFLSFNSFDGKIPTELGNLRDLEQLYLYGNELTGSIPTEIGYFDKMEIFTVAENPLSGSIPTQVNNMLNIRTFSAHNNINFKGKLTGSLPTFDRSPALDELFLGGNGFTGKVPRNLMQHSNRTHSLVTVNLAKNELTGTLPTELLRFQSLNLDVTGNKMTSIPSNLCAKGAWMSGLVETFGCNALLCPVGTYNIVGRQTSESNNCTACPSAVYLGATECETTQGQPDWKILAALYINTQGSDWIDTQGWQSLDNLLQNANLEDLNGAALNVCQWSGVTCENGAVVKVELPNNNMVGTIPVELFQLSALTKLDLSRNALEFDDTIGITAIGLSNSLTSLSLSGTKLSSLDGIDHAQKLTKLFLDGLPLDSSPFHPDIFALTKLEVLHVQYSFITGKLPTLIGKLSNLVRLNLYNNELTGRIPSEIGLLQNLHSLELSENSFSGALPAQFFSLSKLERFHIHQVDGQLSGPLPPFDNFPHLHELSLDSNKFSGPIPPTFLSGVTNKTRATTISMTYNDLTGPVPALLDSFDDLDIHLEGNQISAVPSVLCDNAKWMDGEVGLLSNSCDAILCPPQTYNLYGKASSKLNAACQACASSTFFGSTTCGADNNPNPEKTILDNLYSQTGGRYWRKNANWTTPGIPICHREGVTCAGNADGDSGVSELRFNTFGLNGMVPSEIFTLPSLRLLGLSDNEIDVKFGMIDQATNLRTLQLSNTKVSNLENLQKVPATMTELHLANNHISGTFPTEILSLTGLVALFMSGNEISGTIPTEIAGMTSLHQVFMAKNDLTGLIPSELGTLVNLQRIDFADNYLSGNLPVELTNIAALEALLLNSQRSDNKLGGPLLSFAQLPNLSDLDLRENNLRGSIPSDFLSGVDGTKAMTVVLSSNAITGAVPETLDRFTNMYLDVTNNQISALSQVFCDGADDNQWMGGQVQQFQCDAIMCPPGTALPTGRRISQPQACAPCDNPVDAPFYGSYGCGSTQSSVERGILEQLYDKLNGTNWLDQTNWMSDKGICTWKGVLCDESGVAELNLEENGLEATSDVSTLLFSLPHMTKLDIKGNRVPLDLTKIPENSPLSILKLSATGLPSLVGIGRAKNMRRLHVTDNGLAGPIPAELWTLTNLRSLYMSFNSFTGELSTDLGKLSNLQEIYLFGNMISGVIPSVAISQMQSLQEFIMPENVLSGEIPTEFSSLPKLEQLSLYTQQGSELITGKIPDFSGAPNLWYFDVTNNDMTGSIPTTFMQNSVYKDDAVTIYLANNEITGTVPAELDGFDDLDLEIAGNRITGLPSVLCDNNLWMQGDVGTIGSCDAIACPPGTYLKAGRQTQPEIACKDCPYLQDSNFFGANFCVDTAVERRILMEIYQRTGGPSWLVSTNWGSNVPICSWFGVVCGNGDTSDGSGVTGLILEDNNLAGTIPEASWSLPFLQTVNLKDNRELHINFKGFEFGDSVQLLYLSGTRVDSLEGISEGVRLRELHLTDCDMTGTLPEEIYDLNELKGLYIAFNYFSGKISPSIGNLLNLTDFYAFDNDFTGQLPSEIGLMNSLEDLVLAENLISGTLPSELSSLPNLRLLSMFRRSKPGPRLTGRLPSFDRVPRLTKLLLDHNDISGQIPGDFLSASSSASEIDLAYMQLTGIVPESLVRLPAVALYLAGNQIAAYPPQICDNTEWMDGEIGDVGCHAFLCPPKTASVIGRANVTVTCEQCGGDAAEFYGSVTCETPFSERRILTRLYQNCGGRTWYEKTGWTTNVPYCDWYGITCDTNGRVTKIDLGSNNLVGTPQPDLFTLPYLDTLWLHSNPIGFSFINIGAARRLTDLRVDSTGLASVVGLDDARFLTELDLRFNKLEGTFPDEIYFLGSLRSLNLANNKLQGALPVSLDDLPFLHTLRLGSNQFAGPLPSFNDLALLRRLDLSNNAIAGSIPSDFMSLVSTSAPLFVDLASNQLTGTIPVQLDRFDNLTIYLRENKIVSIPAAFCDNRKWNGGGVAADGCDAILCPPNTYNLVGRKREGQPCMECSQSSPYYGQVTCASSSGIMRAAGSWGVAAFALLVSLLNLM